MDAQWQFFFFFMAILFFAYAAFLKTEYRGINVLAIGLIMFTVPFMWNAAVAGW